MHRCAIRLLPIGLVMLASLWDGHAVPLLAASPQESTSSAVPPGLSRGNLRLQDFRPQARLRVPQTEIGRARFPAIDVHSHLGLRLAESPERLHEYLQIMNQNNIAISISLDAKLGRNDIEHRDYLSGADANRFALFVHLDFQGEGEEGRPATWACNQSGFVHRCVEQLRRAHQAGAVGVKFFKQFGLGYRDAQEKLLQIDDPQWDPIWRVCGELGLPVLIHTADPSAFFLPVDANNERYEELSRRPEWSFFGEHFPPREQLLEARNRVIARFPQTTFICAHLANDGEDLRQLADWLRAMPNLYVDTASRISELGRQPYTARDFLIEFQDRVLFGTDGPWPAERLRCYWRFFETRDEYFPYSEKDFPPQGFWQIYGVHLPSDVLHKIYAENALRLMPALQARFTAAVSALAPADSP